MWKETKTYSPEHLRSLYVNSMKFTKTLDQLLHKISDDEDENLQIAIGDARNVMSVLTHRAAAKLGLAE